MAENRYVNQDQSFPLVKISFVTQIEDLKVLPSVGSARAQNIMAYRELAGNITPETIGDIKHMKTTDSRMKMIDFEPNPAFVWEDVDKNDDVNTSVSVVETDKTQRNPTQSDKTQGDPSIKGDPLKR